MDTVVMVELVGVVEEVMAVMEEMALNGKLVDMKVEAVEEDMEEEPMVELVEAVEEDTIVEVVIIMVVVAVMEEEEISIMKPDLAVVEPGAIQMVVMVFVLSSIMHGK